MRTPILSTLVLTLSLTACGGGDESASSGSTATDASDKYVGTWTSNCFSEEIGEPFHIVRLELSKTGASTLNATYHDAVFADKSCSGSALRITATPTTLTVAGTTTRYSQLVDQVNSTKPIGYQRNLLFLVQGNTMHSSAFLTSTLDEDGFPDLLNERATYTR